MEWIVGIGFILTWVILFRISTQQEQQQPMKINMQVGIDIDGKDRNMGMSEPE